VGLVRNIKTVNRRHRHTPEMDHGPHGFVLQFFLFEAQFQTVRPVSCLVEEELVIAAKDDNCCKTYTVPVPICFKFFFYFNLSYV
jgi:hypothetical protein